MLRCKKVKHYLQYNFNPNTNYFLNPTRYLTRQNRLIQKLIDFWSYRQNTHYLYSIIRLSLSPYFIDCWFMERVIWKLRKGFQFLLWVLSTSAYFAGFVIYTIMFFQNDCFLSVDKKYLMENSINQTSKSRRPYLRYI